MENVANVFILIMVYQKAYLMGKGLNVLFWNVSSLHNKMDSIYHEINSLQPDIFDIRESWLNEHIDNNEIQMKGYAILRNDRNKNPDGTIKKGGGICTYLKHI